jgi:hypothetical protein
VQCWSRGIQPEQAFDYPRDDQWLLAVLYAIDEITSAVSDMPLYTQNGRSCSCPWTDRGDAASHASAGAAESVAGMRMAEPAADACRSQRARKSSSCSSSSRCSDPGLSVAALDRSPALRYPVSHIFMDLAERHGIPPGPALFLAALSAATGGGASWWAAEHARASDPHMQDAMRATATCAAQHTKAAVREVYDKGPSQEQLQGFLAQWWLSIVTAVLAFLAGVGSTLVILCCLGILGGGGLWVSWQSKRRLWTATERYHDLALVATDLEQGGLPAMQRAVSQLGCSKDAITQWLGHWRKAMLGPKGSE